MEQIANNRKHDLDHAEMYWIKSQPWLPHYHLKDVYVAPGGMECDVNQLVALGAVKKQVTLWPRAWQK